MSGSAIAFDVGGTNLRGALVDAAGRVLRRRQVQSPPGEPDALLAALLALSRELAAEADEPPAGIGLAVAGVLDVRQGIVRASPNLALRDLPLVAPLRRAAGLPVVLVNDVNAAALGEAAAARCADVVVVLVGTGVGTGAVSGGHLVQGHRGMALEGGHVIHRAGGEQCPLGCRGCFEAYLGGAALARRAAAAGLPHEAAALFAAWRGGDERAAPLVDEARAALVALIRLLVTLFDPERIVLGGGVLAGAPELREDALAAVAEDPLAAGREALPIDEPRLGADGGLVGAALLALRAAPREGGRR